MADSIMGILKKLFGGGSTTTSAEMSEQQAEEIIQAYGSVLQTQAPTPGCVADTSKLPFPKERIKTALIIGLKATTDRRMREMLKVGYIQLADWQEGVGETDQGLDLSNINLNDDPAKLVQQVLAQGSSNEKWQSVVQAEQETLKQELVELGLW
jgi:hypothetical protein